MSQPFPFDEEYDALIQMIADMDAQRPIGDLEGEGFWMTFLEWSHAVQLLLQPLESERRLLWAFWSQDRYGTVRITTRLTEWSAALFTGGGILRGFAFLAPEPIPLPVAKTWPDRVQQATRWQKAAVLTWEVDTHVTEHDGPGVVGHKRFWGRQSPRPWTAAYHRGEGFGHWHGLPTSGKPDESVPVLRDDEWPKEVVRLLRADRPDSAFWAAWREEWRRFAENKPARRGAPSGLWAYAGWGLFALSLVWILAHGGH